MTEFPILQFGASRFLQAHVDLFVSEALPRGEAMGRIAVAGTTGSPESRQRIAAFAAAQPYPVLIKGLSEGAVVDEIVEVSSVGAGVDAMTQWDELERLFIAARCAISNTADRGYETDPADRPDSTLDPDAIAQTYLDILRQPRSAWTSASTSRTLRALTVRARTLVSSTPTSTG